MKDSEDLTGVIMLLAVFVMFSVLIIGFITKQEPVKPVETVFEVTILLYHDNMEIEKTTFRYTPHSGYVRSYTPRGWSVDFTAVEWKDKDGNKGEVYGKTISIKQKKVVSDG